MPHVETAPLYLKRSAVPGKSPQVSDLQYGELAINYHDGILRYRTDDNQIGAFPQAKVTIAPAWSSSMTIDLLGGRVDTIQITLAGTTAFAFTNPRVGQKFIFELTQGTGGNKTYTWPNNLRMTIGMQRSFVQSVSEGLMDRIGIIYTGTYYDLVGFSFGYTP